MTSHRRYAAALAVVLACLGGDRAASTSAEAAAGTRVTALRAAFYYPWYPEAWSQRSLRPYTKYHPSLGTYSSSDPRVIRKQIRAMEYARIHVGISSWWGRGSRTDRRFRELLSVTRRTTRGFRWTVYYEREGAADPSAAAIRSDLLYLKRYVRQRAYLRIHGRFVVFVYGDSDDDCKTTKRWKHAKALGAYVVLKVFPGYRSCRNQPDGWHQYAPAVASDRQVPYSFSISPGFSKADEATPRLERSLDRWRQEIRDMVASRARFQLITTFNEWGEGTAVESADEWRSPSGYGAYLDALHENGKAPAAPPAPPASTVVAAGDIASCASPGDEATAALVANMPGTVLALGDEAYESGTASEFMNCYDPSWGRFKDRTRPAPGNHEYLTSGASGYFDYFGTAAGARDKGYYSFDLGSWHIVAINSNCSRVGGCDVGSAQELWLKSDLARHRNVCTLAYWHHPLFSSGEHGANSQMRPIWHDLLAAKADVVLNGHDHDYERFASQNDNGAPDPAGIREFVVGTGGKNHYRFTTLQPNSEVRNADTFGVLQLSLRATGYDWKFVPEAGKSFTDAGSDACH